MASGTGQPRGMGSLAAPIKPEDNENLVKQIRDELRTIRTKACPPGQWMRVPLNLPSGTFQTYIVDRKRLNSITVTVTATGGGTLLIWEGDQASAAVTPDYSFQPADTRQLAIADKEYDRFTFYADGGSDVTAVLHLGNV